MTLICITWEIQHGGCRKYEPAGANELIKNNTNLLLTFGLMIEHDLMAQYHYMMIPPSLNIQSHKTLLLTF